MKSTSISSSFSPMQIEAYQESADKKIEDFYSYLNLLSDEKKSKKTKEEIKENIFLIFKNKKTEILDFTSDENKKVSVFDFLDKVENQKIEFNITKNINQELDLFVDYWILDYLVEITLNGKKSSKKISQKIYFSPKNKKFGKNSKEVWEIKLGEME